jgi:general secretion pathway protein F
MITRFRYRAATREGELVEGTLHAASRPVAVAELQRQQLYPVAVDEVAVAGAARGARRVGHRAAVALWTRSTATLLGAGIPLDRALAFAGAHVAHAGVAEAIRDVRRGVQGGTALADALDRHRAYFDSLYVATVAAGESSGALDTIFERLADYLEENAELRSQVRSALLYPALLFVVGIVGAGVMLAFVIPRFAAVLADTGGQLPLAARAVVGMSEVVATWWWAGLALVAAAAYAVRSALSDPATRAKWHSVRLELPWVGEFEQKYLTARVARTLGLLLRSGTPVLPALRIARASAPNVTFQAGVDRAAAAVSEGGALAPALAGTFPPLAVQMLSVGEETGQLESLCLRVADAYDGEVRRSLRTMVALVEPAMILLFGMMIGFVALAMLQAIYGITLNPR